MKFKTLSRRHIFFIAYVAKDVSWYYRDVSVVPNPTMGEHIFWHSSGKKNTEYIYIIYDCKPKNMVQFWNSPYCTPYSNTMTLGTSIFSSLLIFRFEKHVGTRLQHLQITHPKNPQGPSNGRVWTWIAGVRVLKIAIFEGSGFLGHWIVRGALSLSLPTRHVRWHHCSLCSNCFTMGRFHSWLLGGILAHANGDINHN